MGFDTTFEATLSGGFFSGILIGFALKKVVRLVAVVVGLFIAVLAYLQYQEIININWSSLQVASQNTIAMLANVITQILGLTTSGHPTDLAIPNLGIPLTGSMSMGFAIVDGCFPSKLEPAIIATFISILLVPLSNGVRKDLFIRRLNSCNCCSMVNSIPLQFCYHNHH
ncbi:MAG TPA: FUN14 domain-containing protein [Candidatus Nitrosopolaris sp.]|nr:FUN14 domain-containing protein [Candidatus Nitrosopolaris sp.]